MASRAEALKSPKNSPRGVTIKQPVREYDPEDLQQALSAYIRRVGVEAAFDLGCYKSLPATFAVRGTGLVKIQGLLKVLLTVKLVVLSIYCVFGIIRLPGVTYRV